MFAKQPGSTLPLTKRFTACWELQVMIPSPITWPVSLMQLFFILLAVHCHVPGILP